MDFYFEACIFMLCFSYIVKWKLIIPECLSWVILYKIVFNDRIFYFFLLSWLTYSLSSFSLGASHALKNLNIISVSQGSPLIP